MRKIGVFSIKGGVGKTTLTANLGAALSSEFRKSVILMDGNISDANLALNFGISYPHLTLNDALKKKIDVKRAIYLDDIGVKIIPSSIGEEHVDSGEIKHILKELEHMGDIILIDTPPAATGEVLAVMNVVDEIIVVTTPTVPSITGCVKTLNLAEKMGKKVLGIVLNRVSKKDYEVGEKEVESTCNHKVIGSISEDENIARSVALQRPVTELFPYSSASLQFKRLAAQIIGEKYNYSLFSRLLYALGVRKKKQINRLMEEVRIRMGDYSAEKEPKK